MIASATSSMLSDANNSDDESFDSLCSFYSARSEHVEVEVDECYAETAELMPHDACSGGFMVSKAMEMPNEHFKLNELSYNEMDCSDTPNLQSWKDKVGSAKCTANAGKDETYEFLVNEVNHVNESLKKNFGHNKPTLHEIMDYYFGVESDLCNLLKREIYEFNDHKMFVRFLATFLFLAWNDSSSASLLCDMDENETFSPLIIKNALSNTECNSLWKIIAKSGLSNIR